MKESPSICILFPSYAYPLLLLHLCRRLSSWAPGAPLLQTSRLTSPLARPTSL